MTDVSQPSTPYRMPTVRAVSADDIRAALLAGVEDFRRAPAYGLFFGAIYAFGGLFLIAAVAWMAMPWLAYPLAAGFALIGPFVAVGLYEVSRRLEAGLPLSWGAVLGAAYAQSGRQLAWMAFVTLFIFLMWMYQVRLLLALFLGFQSFSSFRGFLTVVFTTVDGWLFLAVGHVVGAALSILVFSLTVVSYPLLLDRDTDFVTAMITSVKAVVTSPRPMIGWAVIVVAALVVSAVPMLMGLLVTLPILGHTTWHLYRRAVAAEI
ncbi:DUF2189 domain-containing protein [Chthonobacter rhizosphaerae]|uniref:DUF2189 domain-containing protein n=1 Tax=Chthonobacter rhizosphaerae TaxID=2735553 RepID=UPI0015EEA7AA|nr:DUF2189 domain-containing protein [Chthonobacter rhizosphaerae]